MHHRPAQKKQNGRLNDCRSADQQSRALREAWIALQTWMREKLVARRGAHIPNFCRLTWQIVEGTASGAPKSSSSSSTEGVLMRPVFALDEAFCNAHGLPWRKPAEALLPCCELEYSTRAARGFYAFPFCFLYRKKVKKWK